MISIEVLFVLVFVIAFLYSMVGHGGASGYLAIMAIVGISPIIMKSSALILNVFVASIAFISFYKAGHFKWKILFPFVIASMPASYVGALLDVNPTMYKMLLGICLIIAVLWMMIKPFLKDKQIKTPSIFIMLFSGLVLGFVSGIIGIGGGILLSPLLIIMNWSLIKEASGISAAFIVLNSISGILGMFQKGIVLDSHTALWVAAAIAGGIIGSYYGSRKLSIVGLRYVLAGVLIFASIKLIIF